MLPYLSYTSWSTWEKNPDEFVKKYATKAPKQPQTKAMALGSAVDARVKGYLNKRLGGEDNTEELFKGVERDDVLEDSLKIFEFYKKQCNVLLKEMEHSAVPPVFEHDLTLPVRFGRLEVPLRGKPDLFFVTREGVRVVYDWKVNGFYSQASPAKGYVYRESTGKPYKDVQPQKYKGIVINPTAAEDLKREWADQLSIYAWLTGGEVGSDWIMGIEQISFRNGLEFTRHRSRVTSNYQKLIFERVALAWSYISKGHYWPDLTLEQCKAKMDLLTDNWVFM